MLPCKKCLCERFIGSYTKSVVKHCIKDPNSIYNLNNNLNSEKYAHSGNIPKHNCQYDLNQSNPLTYEHFNLNNLVSKIVMVILPIKQFW